MTIYALSSGPGISGIAVIRVSGAKTKEVISSLTNSNVPKARVATLKKIIKLALVTLSVFILYIAYLHYTGKNTSEITQSVSKSAEILKDAVSKTGEKVKESAIKSIEKKVEEKLTN